jgi:hypothetical protein
MSSNPNPNPNPLFTKWLIEWRNSAKDYGSKMEYVYNKVGLNLYKFSINVINIYLLLLLLILIQWLGFEIIESTSKHFDVRTRM